MQKLTPEVDDAYQRGKSLARKFGEIFLAAKPEIHSRCPEKLSQLVGLGASLGLWAGIHSKQKGSPFDETWPIYGFWLAGKNWREDQNQINFSKMN